MIWMDYLGNGVNFLTLPCIENLPRLLNLNKIIATTLFVNCDLGVDMRLQ